MEIFSKKYWEVAEHRIKKVLKLIESRKFEKVLDVGCADGYVLSRILKNNGSIGYGIDNDKELLEKAKEKGIITKKVNLETDAFPFPNETFDLVFCGETIEHIYNTDFLLEEIRRVLKNNGTLILTTCNLASLTNRIFLLLGFHPGGTEVSPKYFVGNPFIKVKASGHIHVFTLAALKELLEIHGFEIEKIKGASQTVHKKFRILEKIISLKPSLASVLIVQCRKVRK